MLTRDKLVEWVAQIEELGWPSGNGPWIDVMDHALRKHHLDYQHAIVGFALGSTSEARQAAWKVLLEHVNKRTRDTPELGNPGYRPPPPRPVSVIPGYREPRRRR